MYCQQCGSKQTDGAKFCIECGSQMASPTTGAESGAEANIPEMPAKIRSSLSGFDKHASEVQCLECGYKGPMGLISKGAPVWFWVVAVLTGLLGSLLLPFFGTILVGGTLGVVWHSVTKSKVSCPNCEMNLEVAGDTG